VKQEKKIKTVNCFLSDGCRMIFFEEARLSVVIPDYFPGVQKIVPSVRVTVIHTSKNYNANHFSNNHSRFKKMYVFST